MSKQRHQVFPPNFLAKTPTFFHQGWFHHHKRNKKPTKTQVPRHVEAETVTARLQGDPQCLQLSGSTARPPFCMGSMGPWDMFASIISYIYNPPQKKNSHD